MSRAPIVIDFALSRRRWSSTASIAALLAGLGVVVAALYVANIRYQTRELNAELNALEWT